jgi:hypothetical protein
VDRDGEERRRGGATGKRAGGRGERNGEHDESNQGSAKHESSFREGFGMRGERQVF